MRHVIRAGHSIWPSAIATAVLSRAAALAVGVAAVYVLGFPSSDLVPADARAAVLTNLPERWDVPWYIRLASGGYHWEGAGKLENIAFFPAFPLIVATVARTLDLASAEAWAWLGVLISTVLFAVALVPLGLLAARHAGADRARWSVILCACSPFAVFFGLPYTESLFLLGTTALVLCVEQRRFALAIVAGIVVGLTRPTAVVVAGGLALGLTVELTRRERDDRAAARDVVAWLAAASPLLGMAIYSAYVWGLTGHPFMWALVQDVWGRPAQNAVVAIGRPLVSLLSDPLHQIAREPHVTLNVVAGLTALALVWPITKRLGVVYGSVVFGGTLLPLAAGGVASLGRYTAVLFPIYVWLAAVTPRPRLPLLAVAFACVQVVVAALFFTWRPMY